MQDKKQSLVPELRFPGFEGEWKNVKIKDLFKITRGKVLAMQQVSNKCVLPFIYPVFSSQTMNGGLAGYYNDYLYENAITWTTDGANAGEVNYRAGKFYCTNVCGVLLSDDGYANLCIASILGLVAKLHVSYVGNPKLMNNVMAEIEIAVPPSFAEQQKIAECLSSVDDLIQAEADQLQALKDHKKGLMQQLFPISNEQLAMSNGNPRIPRLRFPGFEGEWEETILSDILRERNEQYPENEDYPLMAFVANVGVCPKGDRYDRGALVKDAKSKKYKRTKLGDFIYSSNNLETGSIGQNHFGNACISPVYSIFEINDKYDNFFIGTLLTKKEFISKMVQYRQGVIYGQWKIHETEFLKLTVSVPSLPEQQKIAECLSSLDEGIAAQQRKVEALKEHKKGLMQKLFPRIN